MPEMIPERLPQTSTRGEQRLFQCLQKLPDDYIVYYELIVNNRYPDFVVIAPDLGVMVIEVKGWYPKELLDGDMQTIRVRERGVEVQKKHPIRQAREYQIELQKKCCEKADIREALLHPDGERKGSFLFPFGHFVVLSNIDQKQLQNHESGDFSKLLPGDKVAARDALMAWLEQSDDEFLATFRGFFNPTWDFGRLTDSQIGLLRALLHPEIALETRPEAQSLAILDLRQERNAKSIGDGHRIVYGVAGSGKTVLLICRAKLLAQEQPGRSILVLCFNVSLAAYLRQTLSDFSNIHVLHFDGWAKSNGVIRNQGSRGERESESDDSLGERLRTHLERGIGDARRFDAILIDEAQDFDPSWFSCSLLALKEPDDGDLLIVGDRQQGIRGTKNVAWSQVGVHAKGRSISKKLDLDKNYRNSREILELAAKFALDQGDRDDQDYFGIVEVDPTKSLRCTGVKPRLVSASSRQAECDYVVGLVRQLLRCDGESHPDVEGKLSPSDIAIFYRYLPSSDRKRFDKFREKLEGLAPVIWLQQEDRWRVREPGIKIQTIHSCKGLQYRAVILLWADQLPATFSDSDPAEEMKLMYVALTRPEDFLFITHSDTSAYIETIQASGKATVEG